jgi:hypothetical protein
VDASKVGRTVPEGIGGVEQRRSASVDNATEEPDRNRRVVLLKRGMQHSGLAPARLKGEPRAAV